MCSCFFLCAHANIVYIVSSEKLDDFSVMECKNKITVYGKRNSLKNYSKYRNDVLADGFEVRWSGAGDDICRNCIKHGGTCGSKRVENKVFCLSKESKTLKGLSNTILLKC